MVAVSFGLFVPPRILSAAKYRGLNVHPSMLPDLYGAAPLHHTLLSGDRYTGVTLQTLHPKRFDGGTIVLQTPHPGIEHNCSTVPELSHLLAPKGASMLVDCIRNHLHTHNDDLVKQQLPNDENTPTRPSFARHAPKIRPSDRLVDWNSWPAAEIMRRQRVIGPLWNLIYTNGNTPTTKRIIWSKGFEEVRNGSTINHPVGEPIVRTTTGSSYEVQIRTCDNQMLVVNDVTIEGGKQSNPLQAAIRAGIQQSTAPATEGRLLKGSLLSSLHDTEYT